MPASDPTQLDLSPAGTSGTALLSIWVAGRHYLTHRDQVDAVGLIDPFAPPLDRHGKPQICCELAPLFGIDMAVPPGRRHGLSVVLRRRGVILLVDRIDLQSVGVPTVQPLAPLLVRRLARPWFLGVVVEDDQPLLVLDLRRIATDVALGAV